MAAVFHLNELGDDFIEAELAGTVYRLSPITMGGRARIQALIKNAWTSPLELFAEIKKDLSPEAAAAVFETALHKAMFDAPRVESELGVQLIFESDKLIRQVVEEMLRKYHRDLTPDQVTDLAESISIEAFAKILPFAWGGKRALDPNPMAADQANTSTGTS